MATEDSRRHGIAGDNRRVGITAVEATAMAVRRPRPGAGLFEEAGLSAASDG